MDHGGEKDRWGVRFTDKDGKETVKSIAGANLKFKDPKGMKARLPRQNDRASTILSPLGDNSRGHYYVDGDDGTAEVPVRARGDVWAIWLGDAHCKLNKSWLTDIRYHENIDFGDETKW